MAPAARARFILGLLIAGVVSTTCQDSYNETSLFGFDYSQIIPPIRPGGRPVQVNISIHILDVKVDEDEQVIQFDCFLRTIWEDHRINMPNMPPDVELLQLDTAIVANMWVPNTFFAHVQSVTRPKLLSDASGIILYRNKTIAHITINHFHTPRLLGITRTREESRERVRPVARRCLNSSLYLTKYTCSMNYMRYPMDNQLCNVRLQAYMYTDNVLVLQWHHTGITWEPHMRLKSFDLMDIRAVPPEYRDAFAGRNSAISFEVLLSRKVRNSVLTVYVPSLILIFVSWLSLWVPPELVPGRMVLVITTLLTLTALFNANVQAMPEVSYVKALDVWNLACIVFVFLTIVEYIAVLRFSHADARGKVAPLQDDKKKPAGWTAMQRWSGAEKADLLEKTSRILLPVAFFIFNAAYWGYYLS